LTSPQHRERRERDLTEFLPGHHSSIITAPDDGSIPKPIARSLEDSFGSHNQGAAIR